MRRVIFKGTEGVERTVWVPHGYTVERALEARGYNARSEDGYNPWNGNDKLISVAGSTEKNGSAYRLFMTADRETFELVWEAIEISFPHAFCDFKELERPA